MEAVPVADVKDISAPAIDYSGHFNTPSTVEPTHLKQNCGVNPDSFSEKPSQGMVAVDRERGAFSTTALAKAGGGDRDHGIVR